MSEPAPLVVFSDDWGRHPSSCQHLIRHLLPRRRVTWVNTIGLRPPRFDRATAHRGVEKLRSWFPASGGRKPPESSSQPLVLSPLMWPSFRSRLARGLNRRLLARTVRRATESGPAPVVVTTLPVVADLLGRVRAARWVYYCVDDYSTWPGLDGRTLRAREAELAAKVDVAVAVSETLQTHLAKLGRPAHLLTHGVDLDFWRKPGSPRDALDLPRPLVTFWGVIDRRTDVNFVRKLGEMMTEGTILLIGPQDHPDPALLRCARVRTLPPVPFDDLPALAASSAVLIAPYADLPVTRAMQPLKLKEYLATGKPVVVRKLPATESWADCADVVETPEAFARAVLERLQTGLPDEQRRARMRLGAESWAAKAEQFERWIDGPGAG
jgi:glycosyltransferase involved in cell wall biosynthesis